MILITNMYEYNAYQPSHSQQLLVTFIVFIAHHSPNVIIMMLTFVSCELSPRLVNWSVCRETRLATLLAY